MGVETRVPHVEDAIPNRLLFGPCLNHISSNLSPGMVRRDLDKFPQLSFGSHAA